LSNLKEYAQFLAKIREFFNQNSVLEVNTKSLLNYPTLDNNIDSIQVITNQKFEQKTYYLHTSPELEMKKLLAKGSGNIYQISKVYRDNEIGKHNFNEFMMLEYYLVNHTMGDLIQHTLKLIDFIGIGGKIYQFSYNELLQKYAGIDSSLSYEDLKSFATQHNLTTQLNYADLQILIWVHFVEQQLKNYPICVVYDFPKEQSAYAKIHENVAKRFEIYINGSEIANGYEELLTYDEYWEVFNKQAQLKNLAVNNEFLESIKNNPLPKCSGVAIGLERLFNNQTLSD
jgi:lysyl-tRNA synthetase class 2